MEVQPGTTAKLDKLSVDIEDPKVNYSEKALPNGVLIKTNEPGAMGIGSELIKEVNDSIKSVRVKWQTSKNVVAVNKYYWES